jgi:hypothetical protein
MGIEGRLLSTPLSIRLARENLAIKVCHPDHTDPGELAHSLLHASRSKTEIVPSGMSDHDSEELSGCVDIHKLFAQTKVLEHQCIGTSYALLAASKYYCFPKL